MRAAIVLFLAGLACTAARAASLPHYPFVYVQGQAQRDLPPDEARGTLEVAAVASDSAAASARVEERVQAILELLAAHAVAPADLRADQISKQAIEAPTTPNAPPTISGYRITRRIAFELRRIGDWPAVADALLGMPNVDDLGVTFDRSDRRAVQAELLAAAAADARARAGALARSFDRRLGPAVAISQAPFADLPGEFGFAGGIAPRFAMVTAAAPFGGSRAAVPPTIRLSASVNAVFRLQ